MRIRHFVSIIVLGSILSVGAFGQSVSGRVTGIAVDPSDPSGNTIYVSTSGGGVWNTVATLILLVV